MSRRIEYRVDLDERGLHATPPGTPYCSVNATIDSPSGNRYNTGMMNTTEHKMDQLQYFVQVTQEFAEMDDVNGDLQFLAAELSAKTAEDLLAELDAEWLAAALLNCHD